MLWIIVLIMSALWLLGMVTSFTMGGFIHILLVVTIIAVSVKLILGRKLISQ